MLKIRQAGSCFVSFRFSLRSFMVVNRCFFEPGFGLNIVAVRASFAVRD